MTATVSTAARRPRHRVSFLGVVGELLITFGVIVLLYVAWQLWVGDMIYGAQRTTVGQERVESWAQVPPSDPVAAPPPGAVTEPVVLPEPADAEVFGVMRIPRFGPDYFYDIAGGITRERTLDPIGIGHYPGTAMPGQPGNFALAAHRTTWGKPFHRIADLRVGDAIVVETEAGWYTYRFRTLEYVTPDEVSVLAPVPQVPDAQANGAYITLTSCSPMYSLAERIVAYGVFESFTPRSSGPPTALTEGVV